MSETPQATGLIRHIVFFTARSPEERGAVAEGLSLLKQIPHVQRLEVGENLSHDEISSPVDFVVYAEFADLAALEAYKAHPLYAEAIARVRPKRDLRIAADYRVPGIQTAVASND